MMSSPLILVPFGVFVGFFSGLMGLGGGAVIIPILVLLFSFDQAQAHGTSLAMILSPTAVPAIWKYHTSKLVDWRLVLWVVPGMLIGSYLGAKLATSIRTDTLRLVFGFVLVYVAGYSIFGKDNPGRSMALAGVLVVIAVAMYWIVKLYDATPRT